MLKITVNGNYETKTGTGQSDLINYEKSYYVSGTEYFHHLGHAIVRFIPDLLKADKKLPSVTRLRKTFIDAEEVTEIEKEIEKEIKDKEGNVIEIKKEVKKVKIEKEPIDGLDMAKANAEQIQDVANYFNLIKVKKPNVLPLPQAREDLIIAYIEAMNGLDLSRPEEKLKLDFFYLDEKTKTVKLNAKEKFIIELDKPQIEYINKTSSEKEEEKLSWDDINK